MDLSDVHAKAIAEWAVGIPQIQRVVLFGSYAKGTSTPQSDVDVAIEIFEAWKPLTIFITEGEEWQTELRRITGLDVNIELMHPIEAPRAYAFIQDGGVVLFSRS